MRAQHWPLAEACDVNDALSCTRRKSALTTDILLVISPPSIQPNRTGMAWHDSHRPKSVSILWICSGMPSAGRPHINVFILLQKWANICAGVASKWWSSRTSVALINTALLCHLTVVVLHLGLYAHIHTVTFVFLSVARTCGIQLWCCSHTDMPPWHIFHFEIEYFRNVNFKANNAGVWSISE